MHRRVTRPIEFANIGIFNCSGNCMAVFVYSSSMSGIELIPWDLLNIFSSFASFSVVGSNSFMSMGKNPPVGCGRKKVLSKVVREPSGLLVSQVPEVPQLVEMDLELDESHVVVEQWTPQTGIACHNPNPGMIGRGPQGLNPRHT